MPPRSLRNGIPSHKIDDSGTRCIFTLGVPPLINRCWLHPYFRKRQVSRSANTSRVHNVTGNGHFFWLLSAGISCYSRSSCASSRCHHHKLASSRRIPLFFASWRARMLWERRGKWPFWDAVPAEYFGESCRKQWGCVRQAKDRIVAKDLKKFSDHMEAQRYRNITTRGWRGLHLAENFTFQTPLNVCGSNACCNLDVNRQRSSYTLFLEPMNKPQYTTTCGGTCGRYSQKRG